jgi:hypothetical protein
MGHHAFRCPDKNCNWRGIIKRNKITDIYRNKSDFLILYIILLLLTIITFIIILYNRQSIE